MSVTPKRGHEVALSLLDTPRYRRKNLIPNEHTCFRAGRPRPSGTEVKRLGNYLCIERFQIL
jgi:hypothetical protein